MKSFVISFVLIVSYTLSGMAQHEIPVADCEPPQASVYLDINNVRALIRNGSGMWYEGHNGPQYEVPSGSEKHMAYLGDLWIGAKDNNDQIYIMAQMYKQFREASYSGPLVAEGDQAGTTNLDVCRDYDKLYKIDKSEVKKFREWYACKQNSDCNTEENFPGYVIPDIILNWPAHGPEGGYSYYLAPFWDNNNDGVYNPYDGDFPYFEFPEDSITDNLDCIDIPSKSPKLNGDQCIWYVFNDAGNYTGSPSMGMEIQAQAYAFQTNGILNNQTFYNYRIINRSTNNYHDVWFGMFIDPDIGNPYDDYIGCDVSRGLGYSYNGDNYDENNSTLGYGENPPAFGIDFLAGPYQDADSKDNASNWVMVDGVKQLDCNAADFMNGNINGQNFGEGVVDNERWGMTHFKWYNAPRPWPQPADISDYSTPEYYNLLTGYWENNMQVYYGGHGFNNLDSTNVPTMFMFPGAPTTDSCGWGQNGQVMPGWSEISESNEPWNRLMLMSTGPVSMPPGAVNNITLAALYACDVNTNGLENVEALQRVDDAVQAKFDKCFRTVNGIDDPDLKIVELDGKLIFHIMNSTASNNYLESYEEQDFDLQCENCDPYYRLQGYQIFQLKDETVDFFNDRYDTTKIKEIFQCDLYDNVEDLVNYYYNPETGSLDDQLEVEASNNGIKHSFELTTDAFPWGDDNRLVNHKTMYFIAKAYASNTDCIYNPFDQDTYNCQKQPYLTGQNTPKVYKVTAHKPEPENNGTNLSSDYGLGVSITQLAGNGNENNIIELSTASVDTIMSGYPWCDNSPDYQAGFGPVNIRIIDPLSIKEGEYTLFFKDNSTEYYGKILSGCQWVLINQHGDSIWSEKSITNNKYEKLIPEYGLSINIRQPRYALMQNRNQNGFLEASLNFEENTWLSFLPDGDNPDPYNWIRCGTNTDPYTFNSNPNYEDLWVDPDEYYENILGGTWAPAFVTSDFKYGPLYNRSQMSPEKFGPLSSVDVVITPDKNKWSRCVVLEMNENKWTTNEFTGYQEEVNPLVNDDSEGNALRFDLRQHPSVDKNGNNDNSGTHGMSWFPGYAIDVRTGERLNIIFGEDSGLPQHNGNDMIWNPTSIIEENDDVIFGGKHYLWVMGHTNYVLHPQISSPAYDSCQHIYDQMIQYENSGDKIIKRQALCGMMWSTIPYLSEDHELLESNVKIRLRVVTPYYRGIGEFVQNDSLNDNYPAYRFNTEGMCPDFNNQEVAESALDLIRVVPNPYYGYSYYESSGTRCVKITNLPQTCTISIFDVSGTLVRRFTKSDDMPWLEWDLNDQSGKRIGGGMYIIHIDAPEIGEKVVKWFGAMSE